jgi:predicted amidohydrolase
MQCTSARNASWQPFAQLFAQYSGGYTVAISLLGFSRKKRQESANSSDLEANSPRRQPYRPNPPTPRE